MAAAENRPTADRPAADKAGAWVVQVGVFAKQANAERLVQELKEQGFHALVSQNSSSGRTLWWVRTGPVAERAAAEQLSARLRAAGHVGSVVPK
jgi:DedD protein